VFFLAEWTHLATIMFDLLPRCVSLWTHFVFTSDILVTKTKTKSIQFR